MSTTIDQKVVEMRFDNKQFEAGVQTSLSTIEKLKQRLNMTGATKGLENVGAAAKGINLSGLSSAAETVGLKFNAMYTIADQALRNIVNSAMNAGQRIVSALTIDPIKTGLAEYETQINAVQTIMANTSSKGTTLDQVNAALDTLNTYADKTIYNFTEMTRNIGTFTAAGVDLDTSVKSIQGIANLAAVSGSTSQQASTAMYQLSQALAAGKVQLMDWNSVVNAGMGGQVFQDALKRTATNMGTNVDAMIKKYGSFRESLTQGEWLTAEVLTKTLEQFTMAAKKGSKEWEAYKKSLMEEGYTEKQAEEILNMANTATDAATKVKTFTQLWDTLKETAQSGWTQTWEIILGDFEEAKSLFSELYQTLSPIIESMSESRNKLLEGALGGRSSAPYKVLTEDLLKLNHEQLKAKGYTDEQIKALQRLGSMTSDTGKSFEELRDEMYPPTGRELLIDSLRNSFEAIGSVVKPVIEAFREIFPALKPEQLYNAIKALHSFTEKLKLSDEVSGTLKRTFKGLFAIVSIAKNIFFGVLKVLSPIIPVIGAICKWILKLTAYIGDWLVSLDNAIKNTKIFDKIFEAFKNLIESSPEACKKFADGVRNAFKSPLSTLENFKSKIVDLFSSVGKADFRIFKQFGENVKKRFAPLGKLIDGASKLFSKAVEVFNKIKPSLIKAASAVGNVFKAIGSIIGGVFKSIYDYIYNALKDTDFNAVLDFVNGGLLAGLLVSCTRLISKLTGFAKDAKNLTKKGNFIDKLKAFFGFGDEGIIGQITDILDGVQGCLKSYQNNLNAKTLIAIASAIAILAAALAVLSFLDSKRLAVATGAMTAMFADLMTSLGIFSKISGKGNLKSVATIISSMIGISVVVLVLAGAMAALSRIDTPDLIKGVSAIAVLSLTMAGVAKIMSTNEKKTIKGATKMILFAAAIKILAGACMDLATLNPMQLATGLTGVTVLMAAVSWFLENTKTTTKSISTAIGITILAGAIKILASACKDFSEFPVGQLETGMTSIGALLAGLALFSKYTSGAGNILSVGVSLVAIAVSMKIFASAIEVMGSLPVNTLVQGLIGMAVALGVVTAAINFLPTDILTDSLGLIAVAGALVILSKALETMGGMTWGEMAVGLVALAGSLTIIAVAMKFMTGALAGAAALLVISAALTVMTPVLLALGAMPLANIGNSLLALVGVFAILGVAGLVLAPVVPILIGLGAAIALLGVAALAVGAGMLAFSTGLTMLAASGSMAIAAFKMAIVGFCNAIISAAPKIAEAITAIIRAITTAITNTATDIIGCVGKLLNLLLNFLLTYVPKLVNVGMKLILGLLEGIANNIAKIVSTAIKIITEFLRGVASQIPNVIQAGFDLILSFINGLATAIENNTGKMISAIQRLFRAIVNAAIQFITSAISSFKSVGSKIMNSGFVQGIKDKISKCVDTVKSIPKKCLDKIKEKISDFKTAGKNLIDGFINGIKEKINAAASWASDLGNSVINSAKKALGINSPSKEFKAIGVYSGEGLIGGLKVMASAVARTAKGIGTSAVEALKKPMSKVADIISGDVETHPVISPVLDLSNVQAQSGLLNSMFGRRTVELAGANVGIMSGDIKALTDIASLMHQSKETGNPDVVSAISDLKNDFASLAEAVRNMQLTLDGNAVVGGLINRIDSRLGQIATHKGRGN